MKYFTLDELIKSSTAKRKGITNIPNSEQKKNLTLLVENILDPLREKYGQPIIVSSGFRCLELNKAVGGAISSQHVSGQAADIRSVNDTVQENKKLFELAKTLPFDQLIDEYNYDWIHVSYSPKNRRQVLHKK